ncbi:MAG: ATP-binding protein [Bacteroidales bacterium]|nr:ATP-binding protein [Bacteroidales bacterium]
MTQRLKYPIGIQSFPKIREGNYVYVDKTADIYNLVTYGAESVFLSRPRRFGKSLLVSTLKAYFEGRKELFEGLEIGKLETKWEKHPVMLISLAGFKGESVENLQEYLDLLLKKYEKEYNVSMETTSPGTRLISIIETMHETTGQKPVVLIDEYDSPLLNVIDDASLLDKMHNALQAFYAPLKDLGEILRFIFITGITKFSQVSIFSTLNNIDNVSLFDECSSICGITVEEMMSQMEPGVEALAETYGISLENAVEKLKEYYDGYKFSKNSPEILNPFSLVKCFQWKEFKEFWFESGTPSYLRKMLKKYKIKPSNIGGFEARAIDFDTPTESLTNIVPLLYQSGYLTIKGYDPLSEKYFLDIPNKEVRVGLMDQMLPNYIMDPGMTRNEIADMIRLISAGKIKESLASLKQFFASVPYCDNINYEGHWQQMLYVVFSLFGAYADVEVRTKDGRVDMAMIYKSTLYLWEIKIDSDAKIALRQIQEKGYAPRFQRLGLPIVKIGINFSTKDRTIIDYRTSTKACGADKTTKIT